MHLQVIEGGRVATERVAAHADVAAVRAEAARRLRESGCEAARIRALLTGQPTPPSIRYLQLQIAFAAETLAGLTAIPKDFRHDRYWPSLDTATGAVR